MHGFRKVQGYGVATYDGHLYRYEVGSFCACRVQSDAHFCVVPCVGYEDYDTVQVGRNFVIGYEATVPFTYVFQVVFINVA